jgi:hypothetical protein
MCPTDGWGSKIFQRFSLTFYIWKTKQTSLFMFCFCTHSLLFEYCSAHVAGTCQRTDCTVHNHNRCSELPPSAWTHAPQGRRIEHWRELAVQVGCLQQPPQCDKLDHSDTELLWHKLLPSCIPINKNLGGQIGRTWRASDRTSTPNPSVRNVVFKPFAHSTWKMGRETVVLKPHAFSNKRVSVSSRKSAYCTPPRRLCITHGPITLSSTIPAKCSH